MKYGLIIITIAILSAGFAKAVDRAAYDAVHFQEASK